MLEAERALAELEAELGCVAKAPARPWREPGRAPKPHTPAPPRPPVVIKSEFDGAGADIEALFKHERTADLDAVLAREVPPPPDRPKWGRSFSQMALATRDRICPECYCKTRHNPTCSIGLTHGQGAFSARHEAMTRSPSKRSAPSPAPPAGDDVYEYDDDEEVLAAVAGGGAEEAARPPPRKVRGKICGACGAQSKRGKLACAECGAALGVRRPDRVITGYHKEEKRHPCADCEAHITAGDEACATCGSKCAFRASERAARARLIERRKKARARGKKARNADPTGSALEALAAEQERLFTAAAARNAAAPPT